MQKSKIEWMPENPYPEKIFPDLDAESQSVVNFVLSGLGLTPGRVFGSWGRQVWDSLCREMERRGEAAKEIGLQQSEGELISANDTYAATEGVLTAQFTPQIWIAVGAKAQLAHDKQRIGRCLHSILENKLRKLQQENDRLKEELRHAKKQD